MSCKSLSIMRAVLSSTKWISVINGKVTTPAGIALPTVALIEGYSFLSLIQVVRSPVDRGALLISPVLPCLHLPRVSWSGIRPKTLPLQHQKLNLCDIQPTPVLRGIVKLKFFSDPLSLLCLKRLYKDPGLCVLRLSQTISIFSASGKCTSTIS